MPPRDYYDFYSALSIGNCRVLCVKKQSYSLSVYFHICVELFVQLSHLIGCFYRMLIHKPVTKGTTKNQRPDKWKLYQLCRYSISLLAYSSLCSCKYCPCPICLISTSIIAGRYFFNIATLFLGYCSFEPRQDRTVPL